MPAQQHSTSKQQSWRVRERTESAQSQTEHCVKGGNAQFPHHTHTQRANTRAPPRAPPSRPPPSHSPTQPSTHGHTQDQPPTCTYAHTAARAPSQALPASQAFESGACDHERDSAAEPDSMALHTKRTRNARMVRPSADSALAAQTSPAAWQTRGILRALRQVRAPRRAAPSRAAHAHAHAPARKPVGTPALAHPRAAHLCAHLAPVSTRSTAISLQKFKRYGIGASLSESGCLLHESCTNLRTVPRRARP